MVLYCVWLKQYGHVFRMVLISTLPMHRHRTVQFKFDFCKWLYLNIQRVKQSFVITIINPKIRVKTIRLVLAHRSNYSGTDEILRSRFFLHFSFDIFGKLKKLIPYSYSMYIKNVYYISIIKVYYWQLFTCWQ